MLPSLWLLAILATASSAHLHLTNIPIQPPPDLITREEGNSPSTTQTNDAVTRTTDNHGDPTGAGHSVNTDTHTTTGVFKTSQTAGVSHQSPQITQTTASHSTDSQAHTTMHTSTAPEVVSATGGPDVLPPNPSSYSATGNSSSGLSSDAKIGIGVGVGVGVVLIIAAIVGFLLVRRRNRNARYTPAESTEQLRERAPMTNGTAAPFVAAGAMKRPAQSSMPRSSPARTPSHRSISAMGATVSPEETAMIPPAFPRASSVSSIDRPLTPRTRPTPPSIFTDIMSPVTPGGAPHDHEPVSPVSPMTPPGSRPSSLRFDHD